MASIMSPLQQARDLLSSVRLGDYLAQRPPCTVVGVTTADPVARVLRLFASSRLVAAPLFADKQRTQYLGFVDLTDIVAAVVAAARQAAGGGGTHALRHHAAAAACQLASQAVGSIRALANDTQLVYEAQLDSTLLQVVRHGFTDPVDHLACHRLAVFQPAGGDRGGGGGGGGAAEGSDADVGADVDDDADPAAASAGGGDGGGSSQGGALGVGVAAEGGAASLAITHIVSQSDMLRFLHRHRAALGSRLLDASLEQLGFCHKPVMCVPQDMSVIEALVGMVDSRVPAVAVIDSFESGRLLGTLSVSDLRGILPHHFAQLAAPLADLLGSGGTWWQPQLPQGGGGNGIYLGGGSSSSSGDPDCASGGGVGLAAEFGVRSPEQARRGRAAAPPPATCTLSSRFSDVLGQLAQRGIHRLWVVDGQGRPAGVVSLIDVLRLLAGSSPEPGGGGGDTNPAPGTSGGTSGPVSSNRDMNNA